jgi:hypothetical protein
LGHIVPPHFRRREARVFDEFTQRKGTQDIHPLRGIQVAESDPVVIAAAHVAADPAAGLLGSIWVCLYKARAAATICKES